MILDELLLIIYKCRSFDNKKYEIPFKVKGEISIRVEEPLLVTGCYNIMDDDEEYLYNKGLVLSDDSYYIYDESGHSGDWCLEELKTLEEVERVILSESGYLNMFCTKMYVVYKGTIQKFKVYCLDGDNKVYISDSSECNEDFTKAFVEWKKA